MIAGQLIKITGTKKLMVKISEQDYAKITVQLTTEHNKLKFNTDRLSTFTLKNDDDTDEYSVSYFCMVSLDKYDKQVLERKFEPLVRKMITFTYQLRPYDFIPDDSLERKTGVNLQLTKIRIDVKKQAVIDAAAKENVIQDPDDELTEEQKEAFEKFTSQKLNQ